MNIEESALLTTIRDNSQLSEKEQQRYQQLWRRCENETLSEDELTEYQALLSQLKTQNLKRIEVLTALAESRGKTLGEITTELYLCEKNNTITPLYQKQGKDYEKLHTHPHTPTYHHRLCKCRRAARS